MLSDLFPFQLYELQSILIKYLPTYLPTYPLSRESNPYKSHLRENTLKIEMTHIPRTESFKGSFSYRGAKL